MHDNRFCKANCFSGKAFDPSSEIEILAFNFLCVCLANEMLSFIEDVSVWAIDICLIFSIFIGLSKDFNF